VVPAVDGFTDLAEIGRGGFGTVYRARQTDSGRAVAIKVLPDVRADSDAYGRFTREFQALAAVGGHPSIARVHACGVTDDGSGYLALELLTGGSLGDRLRESGTGAPWAEVAAWGVALAGALETAHRAGITHRDIKPENVLFDAAGTPKLVDFGIAGVPGAYRTATGSVTLTLAHAAPEVVAGGRGGVPGDVYSLASTLYAGIAGSAAFVAEADETLVPMLARIATAPVPDLRPRGVPDAVCTALERAMAKDPGDRPSSAEALGMSLRAALAREGVTVAPPLLLRSAGVLAPFVVSDAAPSIGSRAAASAGPAALEGDRTLTGWVAPATDAAPARGRRRPSVLAVAASLAAVLALLLVWRNLDTPDPAVAGSGASPSASVTPRTSSASPSPTPTPSMSSTPSTSPTAAPRASSTRSAQVQPAPTGATRSPSPRASSSPPPSTAPSTPAPPASSPTTTPPASTRLAAPRTVRVGGSVVRPVLGATGEVTLRLSWVPRPTEPAPSAYEVRYAVLGGPASGTTTLATTISATTATLVVPAPTEGTRYRWQVRAIGTGEPSRWVTAGAVVPSMVGRRAAAARTALRALGLKASTYRLPVDSRVSVGRVLEQSVPRGRVLPVGSSLALGIGKRA
jgi:serine/threonine protein kinase